MAHPSSTSLPSPNPSTPPPTSSYTPPFSSNFLPATFLGSLGSPRLVRFGFFLRFLVLFTPTHFPQEFSAPSSVPYPPPFPFLSKFSFFPHIVHLWYLGSLGPMLLIDFGFRGACYYNLPTSKQAMANQPILQKQSKIYTFLLLTKS